MQSRVDISQLDHLIKAMKASAEQLLALGDDFPALSRNTCRILASIKMLEINICDAADLLVESSQ
jgi:hypothetical protein